MMIAMNDHHLRVADAFWRKAFPTFWSTSCNWIGLWMWLLSSEWSESSLPRRGGGVKALRILTDVDLNRWIMKSCWFWIVSKLIIQTWPWCWLQTCWYSRASRWSEQWASLTAVWLTCNPLTFSTLEQNLNTWDREWSLKRLSFGRCWPNTEFWTNFARTSEGLRCVSTFSSDMTPSLRTSWIHKCLSSMCFDFLEMPRREAIVLPADESILIVIFTSLERIADFSSLMKCLIARDSTAAWVIAHNFASALECDIEAWVRLVDDRLTEKSVMSEPLVDLLDLWHLAQSESEKLTTSTGTNPCESAVGIWGSMT